MFNATAQQNHNIAVLRIFTTIVICLCVVGACMSSAIRKPPTTNKTCAKFDEYCINHWDCCSNSCLSFVYRCTRNYAFYPFVFVGQNYPAQATLDDILETNFGSNAIAATEEKQSTQATTNSVEQFDIQIRLDSSTAATAVNGTTTAAPAMASMHNQHEQVAQQSGKESAQSIELKTTIATTLAPTATPDVIATTTLPLSTTSTLETTDTTGGTMVNSAITTTTSTSTSITPAATPSTTSIAAESTGSAQKTRSTAEIATADCKDIGEKCYRNEECCTMRCHGFLHQCVT